MPSPFDLVAALRPDGHIRVIAPSSPFPREDFARGVARLRERYRVSFADDLFEARGYLAGDDARRLAELRDALTDPDVDAIVAARGGYGATRLLDALKPEEVRASPKLLVGFSDVTALHALWARAGLRSIHGPMVAALGRAEPAWVERWIAAVEGGPVAAATGLDTIHPGEAEGPLVGGNLAVLAALVGTPYAPPLDDAILFLEDVGEAPYRVDRMLTTLRQAGWLARVRGVALGSFTACDPRADGRTVEAVLRDRLADLGVPVAAGVGAGHAPEDGEVPLGAVAQLDATRGSLRFVENAVEARRAG
ncbi:MAG: LD-carboxypeptidase [Sandaracinaceae bacterium]|nr:LD-carboxypeptidase [Myxococcales bacterium]